MGRTPGRQGRRVMKFSISKVTSDDEVPRYLVSIDTPQFISFYCGEADRQMMITALYMEQKPHPQRAPKGCPCLGLKTCQECADKHLDLLKRVLE